MAGGSESECVMFKVLVIGDTAVGKTSIIRRYVDQRFPQRNSPTIGFDMAVKDINWDSKTMVRLQLWDFQSPRRLRNSLGMYYKNAVGAFVVYDVTTTHTLHAVSEMKRDLDREVKLADGNPIPSVLLANKCDQMNDRSINKERLDSFCEETGFLGWFGTSAKDNINVDKAVQFLLENIMANNEKRNRDRIKLDQQTVAAESKCVCS